mmetsp:Transcript_2996/g.7660  ORF Transcript_2996/g.7660 Transcript_2996/m.7660 type:complete len:148 (+) Transcript_2996:54-497(+)
MSFAWYAHAAVVDRHAFEEVRMEVEEEVREGGRRFSVRQRELTEWAQTDFVPTMGGIAGGCTGIELMRRLGFMSSYHRLFLLLPAIPFYIWPYQVLYYTREARYLVEMMREEKSCQFARRLQKIFQASASKGSKILDDLDHGAEIVE